MILLLLILILFLFIIFQLNGRDILSPTTLTVILYIVAVSFAVIGSPKWEYIKFNYSTIIVLMAALFCMEFGEAIVQLLNARRKIYSNNNQDIYYTSYLIDIPKGTVFLGLIIAIFGAAIYVNRMIHIAMSYGYAGTNNLLFYIRRGVIAGEEKIGYGVVIFKNFATALCYVNLYCFFNNCLVLKDRRRIKEYIPYLFSVIPSIVIYFFSSSRYFFIKLLAYSFICYLLLYRKQNNRRISLKSFFRIMLVLLLAVLAFYFVFKQTGQSRDSFTLVSPLDKFVSYGGSSIAGLSEYITKGMPRSKFWGDETLNGIFNLIHRFFPDSTTGTHFLEFFNLNSVLDSNIYTIVRSLIADYGIIGMLFFEFFIGLFFTCFYLKVSQDKKSSLSLIIYSYFCYGLVYQIFTPLLLTDIGSIEQIMDLFWIVIIFFLVIKRHTYSYNVKLQ